MILIFICTWQQQPKIEKMVIKIYAPVKITRLAVNFLCSHKSLTPGEGGGYQKASTISNSKYLILTVAKNKYRT